MNEQQEGVIKYELSFRKKVNVITADVGSLNAWRTILWRLALIGQDVDRYQGYGFGNVSQRMDGQGFLISGTQTGATENLKAADYAHVQVVDFQRNQVTAEGQIKPSSESLTHALIYDFCPSANVVLHVHSPEIWQQASQLGIPQTADGVDYGTTEMVDEVKRLLRLKLLGPSGVFAMRGHQDGMVAFGESAEQAGVALLCILARCLDTE